jgi:6-pyruvoyltetrahydropterin/6-carboxytetrahydropterin synthase
MIQVCRSLKFCAGHRLLNHQGKCRNLHGHNYVVKVALSAPKLDAIGMIVDFSFINETVGAWIESYWDHGFIVWDRDDEAIRACELVSGQKLFKMGSNPSAENMAAYLLEVVVPKCLEGTALTVEWIEVRETPTGSAVAGRRGALLVSE